MTVNCPLECEYLQDARKHEKNTPVHPDQFPNQDIRVTEEFLRTNELLLLFLGQSLMEAAFETPGAVDYDVRDALDALIRTYRTLQSGLYYDTRPANVLAANICSMIQSGIQEFRRDERERLGLSRTRDTDILGILAFLQRLELDRNNGRKKGRAYLDFLRGQFKVAEKNALPNASPLILG